jgi:hypothetical protein
VKRLAARAAGCGLGIRGAAWYLRHAGQRRQVSQVRAQSGQELLAGHGDAVDAAAQHI